MTDNQKKFEELRSKYPIFRFKSYDVKETEEEILIVYKFSIDNLAEFNPTTRILKKKLNFKSVRNDNNFKLLTFNLGLVELISYWKSTCSPQVIIECGSIDEYQIEWFKKLYFYGLGEMFYTNRITTNIKEFMNIECLKNNNRVVFNPIESNPEGILIPIGGGKDSCLTIELLKDVGNKYCIMVNPKEVSLECSKLGGFDETSTIEVLRTIAPELLKLNEEGFLNGHTPFSSMLAFLTYSVSYLLDIKYIALSNESSANESNVIGEAVNHQYSKSYEFENDFNEYCLKYLNANIKYFSFLRALSELQIAKMFSKYTKYHKIFKSCNAGSKNKDWKWCCNCAKCLFVYIILSPFLQKQELIAIFGEDLYERKDLLNTFLELAGKTNVKPFECVGTFEEVNYAISKDIKNRYEELPYLLKYYKENYPLFDLSKNLEDEYNEKNNVPEELKNYMERGVEKCLKN